MIDNIIIFPSGTVPADILLRKARDWEMDSCLVIGFKDGKLCIGSTTDDYSQAHWLCTRGAEFIVRQANYSEMQDG